MCNHFVILRMNINFLEFLSFKTKEFTIKIFFEERKSASVQIFDTGGTSRDVLPHSTYILSNQC